jgi:hypothetical protein
MKHLFTILLIFLLAPAVVRAEEIALDGPPKTANAGQTELPQLLIHQNTFNALKFQFTGGATIPPGQLTALLNIPENEQLLRTAKNYVIATRILNALTFVSAAGVFIYAGFDNLPYSDTMFNASLCAVLGSTTAGFFTGQKAGVSYLRAVDNYNLSILGIPVGEAIKK